MADFYSNILANPAAEPQVKNVPTDMGGKLRMQRFTYTQAAEGAAGSVIALAKLPAGRVRLFSRMCFISVSALGAARTMDVGYAAHTGFDGEAVAAQADHFIGADDVSTAQAVDFTGQHPASDKTELFESRDGVEIIATINGDVIDAGETIDGYIVYAQE